MCEHAYIYKVILCLVKELPQESCIYHLQKSQRLAGESSLHVGLPKQYKLLLLYLVAFQNLKLRH